MNRYRRSHATLLLLVAAGCGGSGDEWSEKRPAVAPASGTLTYQQKPVEGATVMLAPDPTSGQTYGAAAMTDSNGRFELSAFPPEVGVVPGKYLVAVSKVQAPAVAATDPAAHDQPYLKTKPKHVIPVQYGDPAKSGLTIDIPEAGNKAIQFDLK